MLFSGSCIVADPPEYRAPGQTRPVLNMYSAVPTATQALIVDGSQTNHPATKFSVQIRSEDAGEPLRASFFLDYQIKRSASQSGEEILVIKDFPASTYNNTGRIFNHDWLHAGTTGCHYLTLVVAHLSSFQAEDGWHLNQGAADDDAALATWTVNVVDSPADGTTLKNCPTREEGPTVQ